MKKFILFTLLSSLLLQSRAQQTYPITTDPTLIGPICAGTTFNLPFTTSMQFFFGNEFIAQLSDANGSFASPINVGILTDYPPLIVSVTIPDSIPYGTHYRIRLKGTAPYTGSGIGSDNGTDMTIYPVPPSPTLTLAGTLIGDDSLVVSGEGAASQITWYKQDTFANTSIPFQPTYIGSLLSTPTGLYVDANENIYVADMGNNRIQKFPAGSTDTSRGTTVAGASNGTTSDPDFLFEPTDVFLDGSGNIFVADAGNNRIQKFPPNSTMGTNAVTVAGTGGGPSVLNNPTGVFVDDSDDVYVADYLNGRIAYFASGSSNDITIGSVSGANSVYEDIYGNIYTTSGYGTPGNGSVTEFGPGNNTPYVMGGNNGTGIAQNQLTSATSVYVDANQNIYVADCERIEKFPVGGCYSSSAVTVALNTGCHSTHIGIYMDAGGTLYVANADMNRIEKWTPCPLRTAYAPGSNGSYTATYVTSKGCVSYPSNTVIVGPTSGVYAIMDSETFSLYPNPNSGSFVLQSSGMIGKEYIVYDMIGSTIAQGVIKTDKQSIVLKGIAMGSYTLDVKGNKAIRFVIEN